MTKEDKIALFDFIKGNSFEHQVDGVRLMLRNPYFLLGDEPGAGKTKQVIDTAQVLFSRDKIDRVVVICPAAIKSIWADPDIGQINKFLWEKTPSETMIYHTKLDYWDTGHPEGTHTLKWLITNYEFLRKPEKLRTVVKWVGPKTMLVLDESSYVKTWNSLQTKAARKIRAKCQRVVLLNGTVVTDSPQDLFAQCNIMHPDILDCKYITHFRDLYGVMGGFKGRVVVGWKNLDTLKAKFKPYYVRRLKENCLDLPEKMPPVTLSCPLSPATWRMYEEMRKLWMTWLEGYKLGDKTVAKHATTKSMRLSQLTSGYLGGFKDEMAPVREVGREKTEFFIQWYRTQMGLDPKLKMVIWCRFRQEAERLYKELAKIPVSVTKGNIALMMGGQAESLRRRAIGLLDPQTAPQNEPAAVVATLGTGSVGLNFSAASMSVYLSNTSNLKDRLQSEERVYRPGQINRVTTVDIISTGPEHQRTYDYWAVKALQKKEDMASWTLEEWLQVAKAA